MSYIDREILIETIRQEFCIKRCPNDLPCVQAIGNNVSCQTNDLIRMVKDFEAADAVEVQHGKWIQEGQTVRCNKCGFITLVTDTARKYCPKCGARMDGE